MNEIFETIKQLTYREKEFLFFRLLDDGIVDYHTLTESYIRTLQKREKEKLEIIGGMAVALTGLYVKKIQKFHKIRGAYNLIKSKFYSGTPFEEQLKKIVEENDYSETDGCPDKYIE